MRAQLLSACDICHICGHPNADVADHVISIAKGGDPLDINNLRPAHGVKKCPTCGRNCNGEKSDKLLSEVSTLKTSRDWFAE
ncbi:HNH endonuclease [Streptomyces dengpaensis]|uniref:HNH endonuclease n=1 Tax=Streptomyces dengpaensis TaxID=2049881 RepID=A0ABN5I6J0_9ACTN|nr:HNH endonuclease [Streptomyces dengpaensis]